MGKTSDKDKISSGPSTTESLGISSAAGLTEGLIGTSPLLPNYGESTKTSTSAKNSTEKHK